MEGPAAKNVNVQVEDALPCTLSTVDDGSVTVRIESPFAGNLARDKMKVAQKQFILGQRFLQ